MRIALISDLHSSLVQLDAVLADIDRAGADQILCLGDIVDLGPKPREVIARLRDRAIPCLLGNHDVTTGEPLPPKAINAWCRAQLEDADRAFLASLPPSIEVPLSDGGRLLCVHGSPRSFDDEIHATTPAAALDALMGGDDPAVLACGHTHMQMLRHHQGRIVVNAGSVALPFLAPFDPARPGPPTVLPWAEYALIDDRPGALGVDLRRVEYDFDAYARDVMASGAPDPERWLGTWKR